MQTPAVVPVPHVGGPITGPGAPNVLINGLPAARVGDFAVCVGPVDVIVAGAFTVLVGGKPLARMGDQTAHGGIIAAGSPNVLVGDAGGGAGGPAGMTMSAARAAGIPFVRTSCGATGVMDELAGSPMLRETDPSTGHWIEIELVDRQGNPVPRERYRIVPPDGRAVEGFLDGEGQARVGGIDPGTCTITFPDLDASSWAPASGDPGRRTDPIDPDRPRPEPPVEPTVEPGKAVLRDQRLPSIAEPALELRKLGTPAVEPATLELRVFGEPGIEAATLRVREVHPPSVDEATLTLRGRKDEPG